MNRRSCSRISHKMRQFEIFEKHIIKMLNRKTIHPVKTKETHPSTSAIIAKHKFTRIKITLKRRCNNND